MSLTLHYHPLSSYCWKVLIALYENGTPFQRVVVDLGDNAARAAHLALWPMGKMPVLRDDERGVTAPETSAIIDYLDWRFRGPVRFTPADPALAWRTRLWDRFFDLHVSEAMSKIVTDRIRPPGQGDAFGVAQARSQLSRAYGVLEQEAPRRTWFSGDGFGLADCAAAPALFYADRVQPLGAEHAQARAYLDRLLARATVARVIAEAEPYFKLFPQS